MNNGPTCIGINGLKYAGKDTLYQLFPALIASVTKLELARPLKSILIEHFGFSESDCYDAVHKEDFNEFWGFTNRQAMERIGNGLREVFHPEVWVKLTKLKIQESLNKGFLPIVTDVRYPNEAEMIHNLGGIVINISNPRTRVVYVDQEIPTSEIPLSLSYIDYAIVNDETIVELYSRFIRIYGEELIRPLQAIYGKKNTRQYLLSLRGSAEVPFDAQVALNELFPQNYTKQ